MTCAQPLYAACQDASLPLPPRPALPPLLIPSWAPCLQRCGSPKSIPSLQGCRHRDTSPNAAWQLGALALRRAALSCMNNSSASACSSLGVGQPPAAVLGEVWNEGEQGRGGAGGRVQPVGGQAVHQPASGSVSGFPQLQREPQVTRFLTSGNVSPSNCACF